MADAALNSMQAYFECLRMVSEGPHEKLTPENNLRAQLNQLKDAGLISVGAATLSGTMHLVSITPHGAVTLAQWADYIEGKSLRGGFMGFAKQAFWVLLGAFAGAASDLVGYFTS